MDEELLDSHFGGAKSLQHLAYPGVDRQQPLFERCAPAPHGPRLHQANTLGRAIDNTIASDVQAGIEANDPHRLAQGRGGRGLSLHARKL
jgi:hypothetical protein